MKILFFENLCSVQATEGRWVQSASKHSTEQEIEFLLFSKGRGQKKNCEKAVRLTAWVDPPPSPEAVRKM